MNKEFELLHNATIALGFVNMKLAIAVEALEKIANLEGSDLIMAAEAAKDALELMKEAHNPPEPEQSKIVRLQ